MSEWPIASAVAEEIDDHHAMTRRNEWNDIAPEVPGRRKPMNEDYRLSSTACPGGVVVEPDATEIDEFTAHRCGVRAVAARLSATQAESPVRSLRFAGGEVYAWPDMMQIRRAARTGSPSVVD
jgi:hypothetical protein